MEFKSDVNLTSELKQAATGFGIIFIIYLLTKLFGFQYLPTLGIITLSTLGMMLYFKTFKWFDFFKNIAYIAILLGIIFYLGPIVGSSVVIGVVAIYILWSRKKVIKEQIERIETQIWGESLSEYKKKGEKPPKIRFKF